jgi:serine/threonine protein kinase
MTLRSSAVFRKEAASTGRIRQQNVVTVYECGQTDDDSPYIAMEFLEGESLADTMHRREPCLCPRPPKSCVDMPEACIDARSDIYSLAIVAYEMITARLPFKAGTEMAFLDTTC